VYPELIPPTVPEVRRLISAMMGPEEKRKFRLGWSLFRRAHQAVAKRSHKATHRAKHASYDHHATYHDPRRGGEPDPLAEASEASAPRTPTHAPKAGGLLADEHWEPCRFNVLEPSARSSQKSPSRHSGE
jgi:hypothetical protein